ncbi:MAG: hypothetical protein VB018_03790 [Lachnospiraceae bacterium]|nr:hypothetical protein [Lachnospiraceae bacterium]
MKKFLTITLATLCIVSLNGCGKKEQAAEPAAAVTVTEEKTEAPAEEETKEEAAVPSEEAPAEEEKEPVEHRTGEEIVGISDQDISDVDIIFDDTVRNDKTTNWRLARTADNIDFCKYALSYYNEYYKSDDEIHFMVNFTNKTTANMFVMSDYAIEVTFHEYVDKEEHDANTLGSGTVLETYFIYLDNGDIEKIS